MYKKFSFLENALGYLMCRKRWQRSVVTPLPKKFPGPRNLLQICIQEIKNLRVVLQPVFAFARF